jgi:hypothetical protein
MVASSRMPTAGPTPSCLNVVIDRMAQHEELGVLRRVRTGQRRPADQTTSDQVPRTQPQSSDHAYPAGPAKPQLNACAPSLWHPQAWWRGLPAEWNELKRGPAAHGWIDQRWTLARISIVIRLLFGVPYPLRATSYLRHRIGVRRCQSVGPWNATRSRSPPGRPPPGRRCEPTSGCERSLDHVRGRGRWSCDHPAPTPGRPVAPLLP